MSPHAQTTLAAAGPRPAGRCLVCGHPAAPVVVHGHVQCSACGVNVDPCCGGERACPVLAASDPPGAAGPT